ncbi:MAG: DEAD/DEAH box helicase [Thermodesulfobacteriota bacterium]
MDFTSMKLHPAVFAGVEAAGYKTPTPIQEKAVPPVLEGKDVMGLAQTGTGKTAAFVLPILNRLMNGPRGHVRALIVAPTRELVEQTHQAIRVLGRKTGLKSVAIYGGVGIAPQAEAVRRGAEIIVACPGRLLDHVNRRSVVLSRVEILVLDEADQMFDMGFLPDVRKILGHLPRNRQALLFSATMPDQIRGLANEVLRDPAIVRIGMAAPAETVSHALYPVASHRKTALLMELLRQTGQGPVLVFTRTKHRAKKLDEQLARAGYRSASIQGNLSQAKRQAALDGFRTGRCRVLVATDIAARGIDVTGVSHVINYDVPATPDAYIHRIGRTGRASRTGEAYTLITGEDTLMVKAISRVLGAPIERRTIKGFDYNAAAPPRETNTYGSSRPQAPREVRGAADNRTFAPRRGSRPAKTNEEPWTPLPAKAARPIRPSEDARKPAHGKGSRRESAAPRNDDRLGLPPRFGGKPQRRGGRPQAGR